MVCRSPGNLSFDVFNALNKLLKPPDTLVQSSNDLVAVTARNCANVVDDSELKIDELFFPFFSHSKSPLYRQRHPIFVITFRELNQFTVPRAIPDLPSSACTISSRSSADIHRRF